MSVERQTAGAAPIRRLTPGRVLRAFDATGLRGRRGVSLQNGFACGLVATARAERGSRARTFCGAARALGLDPEYRDGFVAGWDGEGDGPGDRRTRRWRQGWQDGVAAFRWMLNRNIRRVCP